MQNRNRLFEKKDNTFLFISYGIFIDAIKKGNTEMIDAILAAKKNGYELDLNRTCGQNEKSALEILLMKRDFTNAVKLIKAGANTKIAYSGFDDDGYLETRYRSAFDAIKFTEDDFLKLAGIQRIIINEADSDEKTIALRR